MPRFHLTPRAAIGAVIGVASVFTLTFGTVSASGHAAEQQKCTINSPCIHTGSEGDVDHGSTAGWLTAGPSSSHTASTLLRSSSSSAHPLLRGWGNALFAPVTGQVHHSTWWCHWFPPPVSTPECPIAGYCVDHPHDIDLSRIFGSAAADAALPPHSHVVTTANAASPNGGGSSLSA